MPACKLAILGAGNTGAALLDALLRQPVPGLAEVALGNLRTPGKARSTLHNTLHAYCTEGVDYGYGPRPSPLLKPPFALSAHDGDPGGYEALHGADFVVVAVGDSTFRSGRPRAELTAENDPLIHEVSREIRARAPGAFVIVVTNPVDVMTQFLLEYTGFPADRVIGISGVLDSVRLRCAVAEVMDVPAEKITHTLVIGPHDPRMVPLVEWVLVDGAPLIEIAAPQQTQRIAAQTRRWGPEIAKNGVSTGLPTAEALRAMLAALASKECKVLPCSVYAPQDGVCYSLPVALGEGRVQGVISLDGIAEPSRQALEEGVLALREEISAYRGQARGSGAVSR